MTLCDSGPLLALVDVRQGELYRRCKAAMVGLPKPLITTWPCLTEAMYLAGRQGGRPLQRLLWQYVDRGFLRFHLPERSPDLSGL